MFIEADLHCHSVASTHAYSTVKELAESAYENGLKLFALTDHAPEMEDAPHIWHFHNLSVLPRYIKNVIVLKGVEANLINKEGEIDLTDYDLKCIEWVVVSCHEPVIKPGSSEDNTRAYLNLIKNHREVDLIGHPTTWKYPVDFNILVKVCKEYEVFLELNESSVKFGRSPVKNCIEMLNICKKYSTPVIVNTDCHYSDIIGKTPIVNKIIEDIGFPKELIFNRKSQNIINYLEKKKNIII